MIHTRYKWTGIRFNESIITKSKSAQTTHNKNESVVIKQTTTKPTYNILVQQTLCKSQLILIKLKWPINGADKWIGQWFKATDHLKWSIRTERSGYVAKFIWVGVWCAFVHKILMDEVIYCFLSHATSKQLFGIQVFERFSSTNQHSYRHLASVRHKYQCNSLCK